MNTRIGLMALGVACAAALAHDGHAHDDPAGQGHTHGTAEPESKVEIVIEDGFRIIRANGIPNHNTGEFPNRGNPNAMSEQQHEYRVPLEPQDAPEPISARPEFGIAINGVVFDSGTGEFWSPNGRTFGGGSEWNYEALTGGINLGIDANHAHVQPSGKYHYHGVPVGLIESLASDAAGSPWESAESEDAETTTPGKMLLIGWAGDGYPIYAPFGHTDPTDPESEIVRLTSSYRVKEGERPESPEGPGGEFDGTFTIDWEYIEGEGDLDECNGRHGVTPEFPEGTYYYVVTEEFPSVPRMWKGEPDPSWQRRAGPSGEARERPGRNQRPGRGQRPGRRPPPRDR